MSVHEELRALDELARVAPAEVRSIAAQCTIRAHRIALQLRAERGRVGKIHDRLLFWRHTAVVVAGIAVLEPFILRAWGY
jgi:hypothetical protein